MNWREHDLGPIERRPFSVRAVVHGTSRALRAACGAECALLFVAAFLLVRAAAVLSGVEGAGPAGWAPGALAGALAALAWWWGHPVNAALLARELDRRLRHQGALVTAFELEDERRPLAPIEELVRERVLGRLRADEAVRSVFPSLVLPLGAPVLAALLLALAVERTRELPRLAAAVRERLTGGLEGVLSSAIGEVRDASEQGELQAAVARELLELLHRGGELAHDLESSESSGKGAELAGLESELADRGASLPPGSALSARIEEVRVWLDALAVELEPAAAAGGTSGGMPGGAGPDTASSGTGTAAARPEAPADGSGPAGVVHALQDDLQRGGTHERVDGGPAESPPAHARGSPGARWWPREYDALVQRWVELRRAELDRR